MFRNRGKDKFFQNFFLRVFITSIVVVSTAATIAHAESLKSEINARLRPSQVHEICEKVPKGKTFIWNFTSTGNVNFNIHRHVGKEVISPIDQKNITQNQGELKVDADANWCLMWTASSSQKVHLKGSWSLK